METTSQRKYFKGLRALALTALFCTIALTLFIWGEALTPGDKSAIQSVKVSDNIQSAMKSDEPAPPVSAVTGFKVTKVVRDGKEIDTDKYYIGDKVRLSVSVLPENADTSDLYFVAGNDAKDLSVSEDGEVEFTSWGWRRVLVKSRKNPSVILFDKQLNCTGVNPDAVSTISATIRKVGTAEDTDVLQIGDEYVLGIFTDNGLETSTTETRLFINGKKTRENENLYFLPAKQFFYPRAEGTVHLKFEYAGKTAEKTVTIVPGKIPPAAFTFTNNRVTKNTDGSFSLTMEKGEHIKNIIKELGFSPLNKDGKTDDNSAVYFDYETSNGKIVNCAAYNLHAYKPGTATITYTSLYDKNIKATLHVTVPDVVDGLTVVAPRQMCQRRQNRSHRLYGRQRHKKREMGSRQRRRLNRRKRRVYVRQIGQSHRARNVRRPPRPYRRKDDYRVRLRHLPHAYTKRTRAFLAFPCAGVRIVRHVLPAY